MRCAVCYCVYVPLEIPRKLPAAKYRPSGICTWCATRADPWTILSPIRPGTISRWGNVKWWCWREWWRCLWTIINNTTQPIYSMASNFNWKSISILPTNVLSFFFLRSASLYRLILMLWTTGKSSNSKCWPQKHRSFFCFPAVLACRFLSKHSSQKYLHKLLYINFNIFLFRHDELSIA